jgi:hypothetical protein
MTTARQLYSLPSEDLPYECTVFSIAEHLYEVQNDIPYDLDTESLPFEIKVLKDHCFDGRRTWTLKTVWWEDKPFMIVQNAGREGRDHVDRFITSVPQYKKFIAALQDLIGQDDDQISRDMLGLDEERPDLDSFYSYKLDKPFEFWS